MSIATVFIPQSALSPSSCSGIEDVTHWFVHSPIRSLVEQTYCPPPDQVLCSALEKAVRHHPACSLRELGLVCKVQL